MFRILGTQILVLGETPISRQYLHDNALGSNPMHQAVCISRVWKEHFRDEGSVARLLSTVPFIEVVTANLGLDEINRTQVVVGFPPARKCRFLCQDSVLGATGASLRLSSPRLS